MPLTPAVSAIIDNYESENPGTRAKLVQMLNHGRLGGTGKMLILPVDQGFETARRGRLPRTRRAMTHFTTGSSPSTPGSVPSPRPSGCSRPGPRTSPDRSR